MGMMRTHDSDTMLFEKISTIKPILGSRLPFLPSQTLV
jgi:hypothetical protein